MEFENKGDFRPYETAKMRLGDSPFPAALHGLRGAAAGPGFRSGFRAGFGGGFLRRFLRRADCLLRPGCESGFIRPGRHG